MGVARAAARLACVAVCAGLAVIVQAGHATPVAATPAAGTISTIAGGGEASGPAVGLAMSPGGVAIAGTDVYILDVARSEIWKLDTTTGNELVVAGTPFALYDTGDGGPATGAGLAGPLGIAVDAAGDLYIGESTRVRKVAPNGIITTIAGGGLSTADGVPATSASILTARVAVDSAGDLFIAEGSHHRIRKVDHATGLISTVAGTGAAGFSGDGGSAVSATLNDPAGVWTNSAGTTVWFADAGNARVRAVTAGTITTVAGGGAGGDGGPATSAALGVPDGVWVDGAGDVFLSDIVQYRVRRVDGTSGVITTVAGTGIAGYNGDGISATTAQLQYPGAVSGDGSGNLYIGDLYRLRKIASGTIHTIAGDGQPDGACDIYGEGGQASAAKLCEPTAIATDAAGDIYFSEPNLHVVRKIDPSGVLTTVAGDGQQGSSGDGGLATAAKLSAPTGVALNSAGDLFISDPVNEVVRRVDHATGVISLFAGSYGTAGFAGDGSFATSALLNNPTGLAFDDVNGNLFVADTGNNNVRGIDPSGRIQTVAGFPLFYTVPLSAPSSLAADGTGGFYVGDGFTVYHITFPLPCTGLQCATPAPTQSPHSNGTVHFYPAVVAGKLVAADTTCGLQLSTTAGLLSLHPAASCVSSSAGDGGPATSASFTSITAITSDAAGDLLIVDGSVIRRIQAYTLPGTPTLLASPARLGVYLSWAAPDQGGSPAIVDYRVTAFDTGVPIRTLHITGLPAATNTTVGGLSISHTYTFTVSADNGWGFGATSTPTAPVAPLPLTSPGYIVHIAGADPQGPAHSIAQFPYSLAASTVLNHLVVGDWANSELRDLDMTNSTESRIAGIGAFGYTGDGQAASHAMISRPGAIAVCGGNTYFADTYNFVIRKIDGSGVITTFAGTGIPGYSGDGGPAIHATFGRIFGLACRTGGGLYVSDSDNGAVRIINPSGIITTWWYGFTFPTGLVELGSKDVVGLSDSGGDHMVVELTDKVVYLEAGTPGIGYCSYTGGTGFGMGDPRGMAFDGHYLYVADAQCNFVDQIDPAHGAVTAQWVTTSPESLVVLPDGTLVVGTGNDYVMHLTGAYANYAGNGRPSLSGDGGPATSAQVGFPWGMGFDAVGDEYIADYQDNAVRMIAPSGQISTIAGNGTAGYTGDNGPATSATLSGPTDVAFSSAGDIYISDSLNDAVRKVDHATGVMSTVVTVADPEGLTFSSTGDLFIASPSQNEVFKYSSGVLTVFAGTGLAGFAGDGSSASSAELNGPMGVTMDSSNNLFIADTFNGRVRRVDHGASHVITTVAGNGTFGFSGDGKAATGAALAWPAGVAVDGAGDVYIADSYNGRVRVVGPGGQISTVVAECSEGFAPIGDGGPAATAELNVFYGIALDSSGDVFIGDSFDNAVRAVGPSTISARATSCPSAPASPGSRSSSGSAQSGPGSRLAPAHSSVLPLTAPKNTGTAPPARIFGGNPASAQKRTAAMPRTPARVIGVAGRPERIGAAGTRSTPQNSGNLSGSPAARPASAVTMAAVNQEGLLPAAAMLVIVAALVALGVWTRRRKDRRFDGRSQP